MPLSLLGGRVGAVPTGLWGALSLEPPELRCLEFDLTKENKKADGAGVAKVQPRLKAGLLLTKLQ